MRVLTGNRKPIRESAFGMPLGFLSSAFSADHVLNHIDRCLDRVRKKVSDFCELVPNPIFDAIQRILESTFDV